MTYPLSRALLAATAAYGGLAVADPRHLGRMLTRDPEQQGRYDTLAMTYGARDLALGLLGTFGSERTAATALSVGVLCGVADGFILASTADDEETRAVVLALLLGWAAVGSAALAVDRRRARRRRRLTVVTYPLPRRA